MPKQLERRLKQEVASKKWSEKRKDAYVYGTMRKTGWTPSTQKKPRTGMYAKYAAKKNAGVEG